MSKLHDFEMERWQSTYENRVDFNLSESGVHPLCVGELLELGGVPSIADLLLGYGQSNGSDELRTHIAALYPGATGEHIVVGNGSAEANFVALWELIEPGDEAVVVQPAYMQTVGLIDSLGGVVRGVWLREDNDWQPDPDDIRAAVNARTRVIVITNPNNPTGAVLQSEARAALLDAAERVGAWILADEVYTGAELELPETPSFWRPEARVIATGSLSKAYGLPGLRIGWAVAPAEIAARLWARKDYTTISPGDLTDRLAAVALRPDVRPRLLQRTRHHIRTGLLVLENWLNDSGIFSYRRPDAGAILWTRYHLPVNSSELADRLRTEQSVLIVPGDHFGMDHYIRFGFGLPQDQLIQALARISESIGTLAVR
ncbi:MAG TPA: aminotransferase class I/II-fold pyridoxal phosphate-dependent enzyme [Longimicrobiales bacterium]|nr:aminotransferase class I/II-fold pyridoxal phosphate-dependent enzyme [Longimicrobiales bacterium]